MKALVSAWILALLVGAITIPWLRRLKAGQMVRSDGPRTHLVKTGTPTMGGVVFLLALTAAALWWGPRGPELYLIMGVTWSYALLGWADDYLKVAARRPLGLRARHKVVGQLLVAALAVGTAVGPLGRGTVLMLPGYGPLDAGHLYWPVGMLAIIGSANAVNLTDGLDGLAAGSCAVSFFAYALVAWTLGQAQIVTFCLATVGALVGFLRYNMHPAEVFMGDTGSLALGAGLAVAAILTQSEIILILIGGLFVVEALSVMLQVFWFRTFGRRILRMSPLHHHCELLGWSEPRVVEVFWAGAALFAFLGLVVWRGIG